MARSKHVSADPSPAHRIYNQIKQRIESRFMARASHVPLTQTGVLKNGWKVYQDPKYQLPHRPTGGVFYGMPYCQERQMSPLEKVGQPGDKPCPNCGSLETINRLQREIASLTREKSRRKEKAAVSQQLELFSQHALVANSLSPGTFSNDVSIGVSHDVCADCGTCFDFDRQGTAPDLRAQLKKLRIELDSVVDTLGRVVEG